MHTDIYATTHAGFSYQGCTEPFAKCGVEIQASQHEALGVRMPYHQMCGCQLFRRYESAVPNQL
jgi:hypothetical protein